MNQCTQPKQPGDTRYVFGRDCTWHGPIEVAAMRSGGRPCCPRCSGELNEVPARSMWDDQVAASEASRPGVGQILAWGRGQCYPDFETLESAWRQAMEGEL